tara:strand:- start:7853 stop:8029 length:177 start_codon:yes stop_codon:yes gene_type:complete
MKKRELYKIIIDGKELFSGLTQMEYGDMMENYALEYYQTGSPHPDNIKTVTYLEEING